MKRHIVPVACIGLLCFTFGAVGQEAKKSEEKTEAAPVACAEGAVSASALTAVSEGKYVPVAVYDPLRNADQDILDALAEAKRSKRRVLLEVGGLWCVWCRHMDDFFEKQQHVLAFREKYFVTLKVNYSDENKNEAVLSRYPKIAGYPHIFVLDTDGSLIHSQDTAELEEGKGYNLDKFNKFLKQWAKATPKPDKI